MESFKVAATLLLLVIFVTSLSALPDPGRASRRKRAVTVNLSPQQIQEILDKHNEYRKTEPAANMYELKWNNVLAEMGQEWADGCLWDHGQPSNPSAPYDPLGQNLYASSGPISNMADAVTSWYNEITDYDYDTHTCSAVCGHYTQVVWAETLEVGCGYASCSGYPPGHYVVCNYGPAGNFNGVRPYLTGHPCTQCGNGKMYCFDGLCQADCTTDGPNCECKALCQNCGVKDSGTCSCNCDDGWTGLDCTADCADTHDNCGGNGWPNSWCADPAYPFVDANCPASCGECVLPSEPTTTIAPTTTTAAPTTTTAAPTTTTAAPTTTTAAPTTTTAAPTTTTAAPTTTTTAPTTTTTAPTTTTTAPTTTTTAPTTTTAAPTTTTAAPTTTTAAPTTTTAAPTTTTAATPAAPTCTQWLPWNTKRCSSCGGCGQKFRQRTCGGTKEIEKAPCDAKFCIWGVDPPREYRHVKKPWNKKVKRVARKRKCCYDMRSPIPELLKREKYCLSSKVEGYRAP